MQTNKSSMYAPGKTHTHTHADAHTSGVAGKSKAVNSMKRVGGVGGEGGREKEGMKTLQPLPAVCVCLDQAGEVVDQIVKLLCPPKPHTDTHTMEFKHSHTDHTHLHKNPNAHTRK
eukprot:GDKI01011278.1.p1 GENE.GDKI01011278.1~~GDKI01011278.1.p1  ORF type:complete len:116 (-),score=58.02 GDKI01011278.1:81-428(-)